MKFYRSMAFVVTLVLAIVLSTACAQKQVPQEQETEEIVIGIIDDFSGPMASMCLAYLDAENDAVRYINEKQGGILGYPIKTIVIDHRMDSTLAISGWDRLKTEQVPLVISVTAPAATVLQTSCQDDGIPIIAGGGNIDQAYPTEPSYYFMNVPVLYGVFESVCDLTLKDWTQKGKTGKPKIGFDVVSIGSYNKIFSKMSRMAAEKYGLEYIITATSIAPADAATQVLQVKNFGCDYMYLHGTESAVIVWLKDMERQNFHPIIFGSTGLAAPELFSATGELCVGTTYYAHGPQWTDTNRPGIEMLHKLNSEWHPEVKDRPGHYCRGFVSFLANAEVVKRAVEKAGHSNLNGDAIKDAFEHTQNYEPAEMGVEYSWTASDHQGIHGCSWYTWTEDGIGVAASDWYEFEPLTGEQRTQAWWLTE